MMSTKKPPPPSPRPPPPRPPPCQLGVEYPTLGTELDNLFAFDVWVWAAVRRHELDRSADQCGYQLLLLEEVRRESCLCSCSC